MSDNLLFYRVRVEYIVDGDEIIPSQFNDTYYDSYESAHAHFLQRVGELVMRLVMRYEGKGNGIRVNKKGEYTFTIRERSNRMCKVSLTQAKMEVIE